MKTLKVLFMVAVIVGIFVFLLFTGCKKSADDNSEGNKNYPVLATYKDPPARPSVSIYDAVEWGNDEQVYSHFYYETATLDGEKNNYPLIFVAVAKGQPHIVKRLLSYGENPNRICREDMIYIEHLQRYEIRGDRSKLSILEFALSRGEYDCAKILVDNGAYPNMIVRYRREQLLPLHLGVSNFELVKALIKAGADVNAKDRRGMTPLHYIAGGGFDDEIGKNTALEVAKLLIDSGADVNAKNEDELTPLDVINKLVRHDKRNHFPEFNALLGEQEGYLKNDGTVNVDGKAGRSKYLDGSKDPVYVAGRRLVRNRRVSAAKDASLWVIRDFADDWNVYNPDKVLTILEMAVVHTRQDNKKEPVKIWVIVKMDYTDSKRPNVKDEVYLSVLWDVEYDDSHKKFRCTPLDSSEDSLYGEALESLLPAPGEEGDCGIDW